MIKTKDAHLLLQPKNSNLILLIPTFLERAHRNGAPSGPFFGSYLIYSAS